MKDTKNAGGKVNLKLHKLTKEISLDQANDKKYCKYLCLQIKSIYAQYIERLLK